MKIKWEILVNGEYLINYALFHQFIQLQNIVFFFYLHYLENKYKHCGRLTMKTKI